MMKKAGILVGGLLFLLALPLAHLVGQSETGQSERGNARLGVGENVTIILPNNQLTLMRQVLVVKGPPEAAATKVGTCGNGTVHWQDVELVDRKAVPFFGQLSGPNASHPPIPTVKTKAAFIYSRVPGLTALTPGWHLGSWNDGGACGPGYHAFVAYVIATQ